MKNRDHQQDEEWNEEDEDQTRAQAHAPDCRPDLAANFLLELSAAGDATLPARVDVDDRMAAARRHHGSGGMAGVHRGHRRNGRHHAELLPFFARASLRALLARNARLLLRLRARFDSRALRSSCASLAALRDSSSDRLRASSSTPASASALSRPGAALPRWRRWLPSPPGSRPRSGAGAQHLDARFAQVGARVVDLSASARSGLSRRAGSLVVRHLFTTPRAMSMAPSENARRSRA
jgi:hypothetical protein